MPVARELVRIADCGREEVGIGCQQIGACGGVRIVRREKHFRPGIDVVRDAEARGRGLLQMTVAGRARSDAHRDQKICGLQQLIVERAMGLPAAGRAGLECVRRRQSNDQAVVPSVDKGHAGGSRHCEPARQLRTHAGHDLPEQPLTADNIAGIEPVKAQGRRPGRARVKQPDPCERCGVVVVGRRRRVRIARVAELSRPGDRIDTVDVIGDAAAQRAMCRWCRYW